MSASQLPVNLEIENIQKGLQEIFGKMAETGPIEKILKEYEKRQAEIVSLGLNSVKEAKQKLSTLQTKIENVAKAMNENSQDYQEVQKRFSRHVPADISRRYNIDSSKETVRQLP